MSVSVALLPPPQPFPRAHAAPEGLLERQARRVKEARASLAPLLIPGVLHPGPRAGPSTALGLTPLTHSPLQYAPVEVVDEASRVPDSSWTHKVNRLRSIRLQHPLPHPSITQMEYVAIALAALAILAIPTPSRLLFLLLAGGLIALPALVPASRSLVIPFYPIVVYLFFFTSQRFIPNWVRPSPDVYVLPSLDHTLFGGGLSRGLAAHTHPVLDIIAWVPYGILHFTLPVLCAITLGLTDRGLGGVSRYARAYGFMNLVGVLIQLAFPAVPPWYITEHGLRPPIHSDPGSPAGLARVDALLHTQLYTGTFTKSPVPYGAFPSLHAAVATLTALTLLHLHSRHRGFTSSVACGAAAYVALLWWSTMYLGHHWVVDVCAGSALGVAAFLLSVRGWGPVERWWRLRDVFSVLSVHGFEEEEVDVEPVAATSAPTDSSIEMGHISTATPVPIDPSPSAIQVIIPSAADEDDGIGMSPRYSSEEPHAFIPSPIARKHRADSGISMEPAHLYEEMLQRSVVEKGRRLSDPASLANDSGLSSSSSSIIL